MRLVDIDDIRVMKFLSEEEDPSESDEEREYRNGWNDALIAIDEIQPSAEPEETLEEAEEGIDAAFKKLRDARVAVLPSAQPRMKGRWETDSYGAMDDGEYLMTRCSVCGTAYEYGHDDRYCGFCGTEMEGEEDE